MAVESPSPAINLRYLGGKRWQLLTPFTYVDKGITYTARAHDVNNPDAEGESTDLASVPAFLWGFVGPYGPHLRAALLHDQLSRAARLDPNQSGQLRKEADGIFRRMLRAQGTPRVRLWLMWTAVRLGAQPKLRLRFIAAHLLAAGLTGLGSAVVPLVGEANPALNLAYVGLVAGAVLWWRAAQGSVLIGSLAAPFLLAFLPGYFIAFLIFHALDYFFDQVDQRTTVEAGRNAVGERLHLLQSRVGSAPSNSPVTSA